MVASQLIPLPRRPRAPKRAPAAPIPLAATHPRGDLAPGKLGVRALDPLQRQILCRAINEHIRQLSQRFASGQEVDFVCECARPGCFDLVSLPPHIYEGIRRFGNRFFTKPGHAGDEPRRTANNHIVIIEKTGADARQAIRTDPRRTLLASAA